MTELGKPIIVITGAAGNVGQALGRYLSHAYRVVGVDRVAPDGGPFPMYAADFANPASIGLAFEHIGREHGRSFASVVHLAAYYALSDEEHPLYESVNVAGTRSLLDVLQAFDVEQFIFGSTMLVHQACKPGERIDENSPIGPAWVYPRSKAAAEQAVIAARGGIPAVILRLAGVYDEERMVPTLARQFARIYAREMQSYFYSGSVLVGQSMLHREDMHDAFARTIDARAHLPALTTLLIGESDAMGYDALQDEIGRLMHGTADWPTLRVPKSLAAAGSWVQGALEPAIPDALDAGPPFIKPFMVRLADDHYALDTSRARALLGWESRRRLKTCLPPMVAALRRDPAAWYAAHAIPPPTWLSDPSVPGVGIDALRASHEAQRRAEYAQHRWPHLVNVALGAWLFTQPFIVDVREPALRAAEMALGAALMVFAAVSLSWRATWARWACAAIGALVMAAPFVFWTQSAAAYGTDTLIGALVFAFAVCLKPEPGTSAAAAMSGPSVPAGWSYNPSSWTQRLPIILMALLGLYVSRYLAAYQLGHIPTAWEPFFPGSPDDPRNGTEEIITSWVAKAWPYPDAAIGAWTYVLEILTGIVGSRQRWRTMPWLVILFGLMIAPLAITSIIFIIIQPVVLGTWSTLALIGAAAMLLQIPYSLDEIIATLQFLRRRTQAGRNWLRVLLVGDTDVSGTNARSEPADEFGRSPVAVMRDLVGGGVSLPWNLLGAGLIGVVLMLSRVLLGVEGDLAHVHHVVGALVMTVVSVAAAEVARPVRFVNLALGIALAVSPLIVDASLPHALATAVAGLMIAALSWRRGAVKAQYAGWSRWIR